MKYFNLLCLSFACIVATAQNPAIVKIVGSTITQPSNTDQEGWKNNEWNGLFFYEGTGSPTKLCVTDGTNPGTQILADIGGGTIVATIPAQDFMYIITNRLASFSPFAYEAQIWKSNGTGAGTSLVYTMPQAGVSNANVWTSDRDAKRNFSVSGNNMFFNGYDATNGNELWATDGTGAGTHIVKDINTGVGSSSPLAFCKIGSDIIFTAIESSGRKLWKTDGTVVGTTQIAVTEPFFILDNAVGIVNNKMIFYAHNTVDGYEPYVSDGTTAGTYMLKNINSSGNSWITQSQNAHLKFNDKYCFFVANNGIAKALWRTDGTSAGTIQLTTDAQNASSNVSGGSYAEADANGLWMIEYNSSGSGNSEKLYRSNGTPPGTYLAASNLSYAQYIKSYKGALWMQSRDIGSAANTEPWRCGGNAATTNKAIEIAFLGGTTFYSSNPFGYFVKADKLYFFATPINGTMNLYQYSGDFTFNGGLAGGRWRDSANWNSMMPPGITDTVFINSGTPNALNINGATAYAGVVYMGDNSNINFTNAPDSLIVNSRLTVGSNTNITGNGVLSFKNVSNETIQITNGFAANNVAVQSNTNLANGTATINNNINLANGKLYLNNNNLLLTGNTSTATAAAGSYMATNGTGSLQIQNIGSGARTGTVNFPIGTITNYNPVLLTNTGTADNFSARAMPNLYGTYIGEAPGSQQYVSGAVNATWFITEAVAGGSNADITLQWDATQELSLFSQSQTYLGHFTGGIWNLGTSGTANGTNPYNFSRTGITSFSPFGILNNNAVLPLNFLSFSAQKCNTNQVCLLWKTANEQNVSHFEIERSADGISFTTIGTKNANNQAQNTYTAIDDIAFLQNSKRFYYRIKEVDIDGRRKQSNINIIQLDNKGVLVYPTLVSSSFMVLNNLNVAMQLQLVGIDGRVLLQQRIIEGTNIVSTEKLLAGVYMYRVVGIDKTVETSGKIIKK